MLEWTLLSKEIDENFGSVESTERKVSENQVKLKFKQTSFLTQRIPSLFLDAFIEEHVLRIPSND